MHKKEHLKKSIISLLSLALSFSFFTSSINALEEDSLVVTSLPDVAIQTEEPISETVQVTTLPETLTAEGAVTTFTSTTTALTGKPESSTQPIVEEKVGGGISLYASSLRPMDFNALSITFGSDTANITLGELATYSCTASVDRQWFVGDTETLTISNIPSDVLYVYIDNQKYSITNGAVTAEVTAQETINTDCINFPETLGQPCLSCVSVVFSYATNYLELEILNNDWTSSSNTKISGYLYEVSSFSPDLSVEKPEKVSDLIEVTTDNDGKVRIPCPTNKYLYFKYTAIKSGGYLSTETPIFYLNNNISTSRAFIENYTPTHPLEEDIQELEQKDYIKNVTINFVPENYDETLTPLYDSNIVFKRTDKEDTDSEIVIPLSFDMNSFQIEKGSYAVSFTNGTNFVAKGEEVFDLSEDSTYTVNLTANYVVSVHKMVDGIEQSWSFTYNGKKYEGTGAKRFAVGKGFNYYLGTDDGTVTLNSVNKDTSFDLATGVLKNKNAEKVINAPKTGDLFTIALIVFICGGGFLTGYVVYRRKKVKD